MEDPVRRFRSSALPLLHASTPPLCSPAPLLPCSVAVAAAALASGVPLFLLALAGRPADRSAMLPDLHRALGLLATAAGAVLLLARVSASRRSVPALSLAAGAAVVLVLAPLLLAARAPDALPRYDADAYYAQLTATNARQAGRAGFPAGARLAAAAEEEGCAAGGCHPLEQAAWERSRHAHAGQSPYYHAAAA